MFLVGEGGPAEKEVKKKGVWRKGGRTVGMMCAVRSEGGKSWTLWGRPDTLVLTARWPQAGGLSEALIRTFLWAWRGLKGSMGVGNTRPIRMKGLQPFSLHVQGRPKAQRKR